MNSQDKEELKGYLHLLYQAIDRKEIREDIIDVLRLAYHERRLDKRDADTAMMTPWGVFTAAGGRAVPRASSKGDPLMRAIRVFEEAPDYTELVGPGLIVHIEHLEARIEDLTKEKEKALQAKKVIEVPDELRELLNELATFDESKEEAKTVRRTMSRLSDAALKFTAPLLVGDDRPNEDE